MNGIGKKLLSVVAFIAAFVAVKYGIETYREHKAVAAVEKSLRQIESDGTKRHPNLPVSEAIQQEAIAKTSEKPNAEADKRKRLQTAARNKIKIKWGSDPIPSPEF